MSLIYSADGASVYYIAAITNSTLLLSVLHTQNNYGMVLRPAINIVTQIQQYKRAKQKERKEKSRVPLHDTQFYLGEGGEIEGSNMRKI